MVAGQRKPEGRWTADERKADNLDQRFKSLIMFVLSDVQMNSVINCLTAKSTWDDLILLPKKWLSFCQSLRNTNHVKDSELASLFGKLKYEENVIDNIYETEKNKSIVFATPLATAFFSTSIDEEEVSSDDNEMVEVKVLMALAKENDAISKVGARNGEWVKISMRTVHTLFEINLVHELNSCKEQLLVLKQAKLDFLTMQHVNTKILKENKNLRTELKELTTITETWINSSNKVNQRISEQIPSQKKRILGVDQLTEDPSSFGKKDLVFVKSSADDINVSIPGVERPWLSEAEGFILPNHVTGRKLPAESQRNTTDPSVAVTDSSATNYDSTDESSVCNTLLPLLKKLDSDEPTSGPKTIKSILRSKSTFKAETLKGIIINEPSSALAKDNKSSPASKVNSAPADKLKSVKIEDDPPLAIVIKELNNLKLQFSKSQSFYSRSNKPLQCEKTDHRTCDHAEYIFTMNMSQHLKSLGRSSSRSKIPRPSKCFFPPCTHCGACGSSTHTTTNHYDIEWFKRGEALQAKKAEALKSTKVESSNANRSKTPTKRKPIWYLDSGCQWLLKAYDWCKELHAQICGTPGPKVSLKPVILETKVSSDQNGQTDQNDQTAQTDEILNNNLSESFNHNNDEQIIDNLPNTEDIQIFSLKKPKKVSEALKHPG
ncbi:hypothetical protein Tco_1220785 [Tanacetum coccineum]